MGRVVRWGRRKPAAAALLLSLLIGSVTSSYQWYRTYTGLQREQAARRESEESFTMLRQMMMNHVKVRASWLHAPNETDGPSEAMLRDAEACLTQLLDQRAGDQELRVLLANVLTSLVMRREPEERVMLLEKAARLWEEVPPASGTAPEHLIARATTYRSLGIACWRQGRLDRAVQAAEIACRLCQQLAQEHPEPLYQDGLYYAAATLGGFLIETGHADEEVGRRLQDLGLCRELLGSRRSFDVLLDSLRIESRLCVAAERHYQAHEPAAGLAAAREAAAIFDRYDRQAPLDWTDSLRLARPFVMVSAALRHGGAPREALRLAERLNRWLRDRAPEAPEAHYFLELSQSWQQIGKARWRLDHAADTLDAYRQALAAQRQAYALAPGVPEYRQELGRLYVRLGRKLCELERLDEAEACFREREVLWPTEASRQEAVRELRKWADQVGEGGKDLSPAQQRERQRYLELCARLEKGARIAPPRTEPVLPHAGSVDGSQP